MLPSPFPETLQTATHLDSGSLPPQATTWNVAPDSARHVVCRDTDSFCYRTTFTLNKIGTNLYRNNRTRKWATTWRGSPRNLVLFFACFLSAALARQRFFYALLFAGLQVKGVTLDLLDDVFLLHLAFEATQCIFEGLALLKSYFCQLNYTPKPVPSGRA
jgi:hypothetical protein